MNAPAPKTSASPPAKTVPCVFPDSLSSVTRAPYASHAPGSSILPCHEAVALLPVPSRSRPARPEDFAVARPDRGSHRIGQRDPRRPALRARDRPRARPPARDAEQDLDRIVAGLRRPGRVLFLPGGSGGDAGAATGRRVPRRAGEPLLHGLCV